MYMNKVFNIAILAVAVFVAALFVSCSNETDTTLNSQQKSIVDYLTKSHQPRLIAEADIEYSLEEKPNFYSQWGLNLFRYVSTYYDEDRESKTQIESGDKIEIIYSAYIFSGSNPSISNLFATNDQEKIASLEAMELTPSSWWSTDVEEVTVGNDDDLLPALSRALRGCYDGDSIEVYLTFEAAFGNKYVGMVPGKSAQVWYIDIKSVTKNKK